ncbi:hypothetical protein [Roseivirga thermotolerans]|uniref:Uncharacterized protein n=1 Tax=Roseivirga thermotolerans TaxID=1758176 RepID=A0ABQ3I4H2_9BACT|nr:hypothetical protein [Roseivirga thermotolerans]GHE60944.1 hypothetical protein GCM10011340_14810 [Roseivirga thermotolerans]
MEKEFYQLIDEALAPVSGFFSDMIDIAGELRDEEQGLSLYLENMSISTPIEMDVIMTESGEMVLGSAPPTQTVETSFMPVFHQLKVNISLEKDEK